MAFGSTLAIESERRASRALAPRGMNLTGGRCHMTPRLIVLQDLISLGLSNKEIAGLMGITEGTVKVYASDLFRLTKKTRLQIVRDRRDLPTSNADSLPRMGAFE